MTIPAFTVTPGSLIVVWFSRGAASAVAAKETVDRYGDTCDVRIVNNPVIEEDEDGLRFQHDVAAWLGREIETAINPDYPNCSAVEIWEKRRYMAGIKGAPCTMLLKKGARYHYETQHRIDFHVMGFTYEERDRYAEFTAKERANVLPVLIERKITKQDCFLRLAEAGLELPRIYQLGYPNGNCKGCVKSKSPTYWNMTRRLFPDVFAQRAKLSREIGARLVEVKGKRIFLDELSPTAKGGKLKSMENECGIFCMNFDSKGREIKD